MEIQELSNRIKAILKDIKDARVSDKSYIDNIKMKKCDYYQREIVTESSDNWELFKSGEAWGGNDVHYCFKANIEIPEYFQGKHVICKVSTGATDIWNYDNPQFLAYIDNELICGLDVNHTEFDLSKNAVVGQNYELAL